MRCTSVFRTEDARAPLEQSPNHLSRAPRHHSPAPSASIIGEFVQRDAVLLVARHVAELVQQHALEVDLVERRDSPGPAAQFSSARSARSLSTTLPRLT